MPRLGTDYERLRHNSQFRRLYQEGNRTAGSFLIVFAAKGQDGPPRFGVSVSRKVGNAVVRNRAKRLLRESFLSLLPDIQPSWEFAICARPRIAGASFAEVREDLRRALRGTLVVDCGRSRSGDVWGRKLNRALCVPIILALVAYRKALSPLLPSCCRFEPSCSEYAIEAFRRFGVVRAMGLTALRLLRCHPLCDGGFDPLPASGHRDKLCLEE